MIEIPEAKTIAIQADKLLRGLKIIEVEVLQTPHKLCWINIKPEILRAQLINKTISSVTSSAHYLRFMFNDGNELYAAEDLTIAYKAETKQTDKHQLALHFDNGYLLELKVKMYGFIGFGKSEHLASEWKYYRVAIEAIDPLSDAFTFEHFMKVSKLDQQVGSVKQALATDQHIPGLGNGVLQDILFNARISPKRKVATLKEEDKQTLYHATMDTLQTMVALNGRDSSHLLDGKPGGYHSIMSSKATDCPSCHGPLLKEAYLGGKVIYCPNCQK
ncbi:MAG TPA: DNA-formamidopyrimidine glycosylase family protein [Bacilli bacterium]|nr:DNA-formamidopyrimidine glycosylase family protein [Bacilli bacterium]